MPKLFNADMLKDPRITSRGRITVPREIRRLWGLRTGDRLRFEIDGNGVLVYPIRAKNASSKYRGIGNAGIGSGRKAIARWLRELRGASGS